MVDTGTSPSGPRTSLSAWLRYTWRVEVQGAPAPGGGPVGEWSSVSAPAQTTIMPPDPPWAWRTSPRPATRPASTSQFTHPDPLAAGGSGGYTVDVYRQLAGASLRLLQSLPGQAPPPTGRGDNVAGTFDVVDGDAEAVAGTLFRVVVTDPIGRSSAPSDRWRRHECPRPRSGHARPRVADARPGVVDRGLPVPGNDLSVSVRSPGAPTGCRRAGRLSFAVALRAPPPILAGLRGPPDPPFTTAGWWPSSVCCRRSRRGWRRCWRTCRGQRGPVTPAW